MKSVKANKVKVKDSSESERVHSLYGYNVLDTGEEKEFNDLARLAAEISNSPIARINLVDEDSLWTKSVFGMKRPAAKLPKKQTICRYTVQTKKQLEIEDLSKDQRTSSLPQVTGGPKMRYYFGVPLVDPDGHALGALCILDFKSRKLTDTQKRQLQIVADEVMARFELSNKNTELEKLNEHKVTLMKMLSHDMRSPLNGIIGMSSLLMSEVDDDSHREIATLLEQSAVQLNQMVDEIMSYTLIESKGFSLNLTLTDLDEVVTSMKRLFSPSAQSKRITLTFDNQTDKKVYVDRGKFEQIFGNLLSNALKFTNTGGWVTAELTIEDKNKGDAKLQLQVRDSGVGMDDDQIARLFEASRSTKKEGTLGEKSTGIGLSIIKHFVELHSGNIEVSSRLGRGTVFTIKMPVPESISDLD